jgi:hypothetical protein
MNKLISDTDIPDIKCPNCGKPLGESFGRLKNVITVRCRTSSVASASAASIGAPSQWIARVEISAAIAAVLRLGPGRPSGTSMSSR